MQRGHSARPVAQWAEFRHRRLSPTSTTASSALHMNNTASPLSTPLGLPPLGTGQWHHEGVPQVFETLPSGQMVAAYDAPPVHQLPDAKPLFVNTGGAAHAFQVPAATTSVSGMHAGCGSAFPVHCPPALQPPSSHSGSIAPTFMAPPAPRTHAMHAGLHQPVRQLFQQPASHLPMAPQQQLPSMPPFHTGATGSVRCSSASPLQHANAAAAQPDAFSSELEFQETFAGLCQSSGPVNDAAGQVGSAGQTHDPAGTPTSEPRPAPHVTISGVESRGDTTVSGPYHGFLGEDNPWDEFDAFSALVSCPREATEWVPCTTRL